jgi:hypothetical protein
MEQVPGFMVFWMQCNPYIADDTPMKPRARHFEMNEMSAALAYMESLRNEGDCQFVTMASQTANLVGKQGVTGVKDGKLPSGETYTYTKRDALSQRTKNLTDEAEVNVDDE